MMLIFLTQTQTLELNRSQLQILPSSNMSDFPSLYQHLLQHPAPLSPPQKSYEPSLSNAISSIQVHPTLETALHILNLDLASAHFLVRHMQSPPAYEGMYLHGILHRIEGDFDNARMWYSDVQDIELYQNIWGRGGKTFKQRQHEDGRDEDLDSGQKFLNRVQDFTKSSGSCSVQAELECESRRELNMVVDWCVRKFGTDNMEDAAVAWVKPSDDIRAMGEDQVSGGAGRRKF